MSDELSPADIVWQGKYITVRKQGTWEYVGRARSIQAAVILAIDDGHVLLVEQFRVPLGAPAIELPAGLVGDEEEGEDIHVAAARELEEETGYRPDRIETIGRFASSPGMVSETFTFVRAHGLTKTGEGGGVGNEGIKVHRVKLADMPAFIAEKRDAGYFIDVKILTLLGPGLLA